jgi:hypothetical protein
MLSTMNRSMAKETKDNETIGHLLGTARPHRQSPFLSVTLRCLGACNSKGIIHRRITNHVSLNRHYSRPHDSRLFVYRYVLAVVGHIAPRRPPPTRTPSNRVRVDRTYSMVLSFVVCVFSQHVYSFSMGRM